MMRFETVMYRFLSLSHRQSVADDSSLVRGSLINALLVRIVPLFVGVDARVIFLAMTAGLKLLTLPRRDEHRSSAW